MLTITYDRTEAHHDIHVPDYENFLVDGLVHHNCGKTWAGAYEAWAHFIGVHRSRTDLVAASGMVLVADLDNAYPVICEKLRAVEPGDWLDPATRYIAGKGYYTNGSRFIRSKAGQTIIFRSGEGSPMSVESASVAWLWIDEPPKESHFGGALSRVAVAEGPAWMTFTPIQRPTRWLQVHVEGDPETNTAPAEEWVQFRPTLTQEDCTTILGLVIRSTDSIARQTAAYSPWEMAQRVYGEWEGVSVGRRLSGFSEACVVTEDAFPRSMDLGGTDSIRISMDHGEGTGKQIAHLSLVTASRVVVAREWVGRGNMTPRDVATGVVGMLTSMDLTIHHVAKLVGDVNSAGLVGGGATYNEFVERALCEVLGLQTLPVSIEIPHKGRGSVDAGEGAMSHAMKEGRYLVHESCRALIHSAKHYTGREKDLKDPIDSARYGVADVLLAPRGRPRVELLAL